MGLFLASMELDSFLFAGRRSPGVRASAFCTSLRGCGGPPERFKDPRNAQSKFDAEISAFRKRCAHHTRQSIPLAKHLSSAMPCQLP